MYLPPDIVENTLNCSVFNTVFCCYNTSDWHRRQTESDQSMCFNRCLLMTSRKKSCTRHFPICDKTCVCYYLMDHGAVHGHRWGCIWHTAHYRAWKPFSLGPPPVQQVWCYSHTWARPWQAPIKAALYSSLASTRYSRQKEDMTKSHLRVSDGASKWGA